MTDIPKPEISPEFTLEDIRKLRDWRYEMRKRVTPEEFREEIRKGSERFLARMKEPIDPAISAEVNRRLEAVRKKYKKAS